MSFPTLLLLVPAAVCVLSWFGVGSLVPARLVPREPLLLELVVRLGAGSVVTSVVLLLLGLVGLFERWVLGSLTIAFAVVGGVSAYRVVRGAERPSLAGGKTAVLLAVAAIALLLDLVAATAPPSFADALRYHLGLPERWLELGRIDVSFWDWDGLLPFAAEMHFAQGLALGGGGVAGALGAIHAVLAAVVVFGLARELGAGDLLGGAVGAFLFALQGTLAWQATSSMVEPALTFYATTAAWLAIRYALERNPREMVWSGFFCGAAAGTKYLGVVVAAIVLPQLLLAPPRRLGRAALALGAAAAAGGAWYVKNAIAVWNPVYPTFFGGKWWTDASQEELESIADSYGVGRSLLRLAILPVELVIHGDAFDRGQYVGLAIFLLAPAALLARRRREALLVLASSLAFVVVWWHLTQQARFLLPALACMAAAGGAGAAQLLPRGRVPALGIAAVLAAAGVVGLGAGVALTRQLLPPTVGAESRSDHLERLTGTYRAFHAAADRVTGTLGISHYDVFDYPERAVTLRPPGFAIDVPRRKYVERLRRLGIRYVIAYHLPFLGAIQGCVEPVESYRARYVTSRTRGESRPLTLTLYSTDSCSGRRQPASRARTDRTAA